MTPGWVWVSLGIDPTTDSKDIRRAYARRLKEIDQERDAEGFQRLRAAYEQAMSAGAGQVGAQTFPTPQPEPAADRRPAAPYTSPGILRVPAEPPAMDAAAEKALEADLDSLRETLLDPAVLESDRLSAFEKVVASPALDTIDLRTRTEARLAGLILQNSPASDPLVVRAIERFGWDDPFIPSSYWPAAGMLARSRDLQLVKKLRSPAAQDYEAWQALSTPQTLWGRLSPRLVPGRSGAVRSLLHDLDNAHPQLVQRCDADALVWWRTFLETPRFGPFHLWGALAIGWGAGLAGMIWGHDSEPLRGMAEAGAAGLAIGIILATINLFAIDRPRATWRSGFGARAPKLLKFGWIGLVGLMIAGAALPTSLASALATALLVAVAAGWACVTSEPDGASRWSYRIGALSIPLTKLVYRLLRVFPFLILLLGLGHPPAPLIAAVSGIAITYAIGGDALSNAWRWSLHPAVQLRVLMALTAAMPVIPLILWWLGAVQDLQPVGVAIVAFIYASVLAITPEMGHGPLVMRRYLLCFGWIAALIVAEESKAHGQGGAASLWMGIWLLLAATIATVSVIRAHGLAARRAQPS